MKADDNTKTQNTVRKSISSATTHHQLKPVFFIFVQEQMKNRPVNINGKEYLKQLGKMLRTMSDAEQQKYKLMAIAYKNDQAIT